MKRTEAEINFIVKNTTAYVESVNVVYGEEMCLMVWDPMDGKEVVKGWVPANLVKSTLKN